MSWSWQRVVGRRRDSAPQRIARVVGSRGLAPIDLVWAACLLLVVWFVFGPKAERERGPSRDGGRKTGLYLPRIAPPPPAQRSTDLSQGPLAHMTFMARCSDDSGCRVGIVEENLTEMDRVADEYLEVKVSQINQQVRDKLCPSVAGKPANGSLR